MLQVLKSFVTDYITYNTNTHQNILNKRTQHFLIKHMQQNQTLPKLRYSPREGFNRKTPPPHVVNCDKSPPCSQPSRETSHHSTASVESHIEPVLPRAWAFLSLNDAYSTKMTSTFDSIRSDDVTAECCPGSFAKPIVWSETTMVEWGRWWLRREDGVGRGDASLIH